MIAQEKTNISEADNKNRFGLDLGLYYTPILNKDLTAGNFDLRYYWSKRFCAGFSIYGGSKITSDEFGYDVKEPRLDYAGISILSEVNIVNTHRVRVNLSVNNGFAQIELVDRSEKIKTGSKNIFLEYHAKSITYNSCYLLEPGLDISFLLRKENNMYLTLKSKYRLAYGDTPLGSNALMSGYHIGLSLSFLFPKLD